MPRGYRCIVLAALGWLILAASPPRQEPAAEQRQTEQPIAKSLRDIATSLQKANEPDAPDAGCTQGEEDRHSDLCAQWKAADAAAESALWTERTFYLGIGGLLIGLLTLGAAGAAAYYAREAAHQTRRGAEAAENAIAETRRIGEAQVRCYIGVEGAVIRLFSRGLIKVELTVRNSGQSPAADFAWNYEWNLRVSSSGSTWKSDPATSISAVDLSFDAGESRSVGIHDVSIFANDAALGELQSATEAIFNVTAHLAWQDVFGTRFNKTVHFYTVSKPMFDEPMTLNATTRNRFGKQDEDERQRA